MKRLIVEESSIEASQVIHEMSFSKSLTQFLPKPSENQESVEFLDKSSAHNRTALEETPKNGKLYISGDTTQTENRI